MTHPQTELETLRQRNTELRLEVEYYKITIAQLTTQCRTWEQVAIAAVAKAKKLEDELLS